MVKTLCELPIISESMFYMLHLFIYDKNYNRADVVVL